MNPLDREQCLKDLVSQSPLDHPPQARFRYQDVFTLKADRTRIYTVEAIHSLSNTIEVRKGNSPFSFKLHLLEWLLQRGDIIILKDGPTPDPRIEKDKEKNAADR